MKKKASIMRVAATLLLAVLTTATSLAVTSADGLWEYNVNNNSQCTIRKYKGNNTLVTVIPKKIDGNVVIGISVDALSENTNLKTLCFYQDAQIENMPYVSYSTQFREINIVDDNWNPIEAKNNTLPESIVEIGNAFMGTSITTINMPNVTSIGDRAFEGCNRLESVTFGKPASIGLGSFARINSVNAGGQNVVTHVYYPGPMSNWSWMNYQFSPNLVVEGTYNGKKWYCGWCGDVWNGSNSNYYDNVSCLYWTLDADGNMVVDCIPQDIVLDNYLSKQEVKTTHWKDYSANINKLTMAHVYAIKKSSFEYCRSLRNVEFSTNLHNMDESAFRGCEALTSIVIPNSVVTIGQYVFYGCNSLSDVYFDGTKSQWDMVSKGYSWKPDATKEHWHSTVTFDTNGHGTAPEAQTYWSNDGKKVIRPNDLSVKGYYFTGWYTKVDCTKQYDFDAIVVNDMTLYAGWVSTDKPCAATFTTEAMSIDIPYGQEWTDIPVTVNSLTLGWFQNANSPVRVADSVVVTPFLGSGATSSFNFINTSGGDNIAAYKGAGFHKVGNKKSEGMVAVGDNGTLWVYIPKDVWENAEPGTYLQSLYYDAVFICNSVTPLETYDYSLGSDGRVTLFLTGPERVIPGDVNHDGFVTMADANMVVNYFLAAEKPEDFDVEAANVNGDTDLSGNPSITMADANQIVNMFLNGK